MWNRLLLKWLKCFSGLEFFYCGSDFNTELLHVRTWGLCRFLTNISTSPPLWKQKCLSQLKRKVILKRDNYVCANSSIMMYFLIIKKLICLEPFISGLLVMALEFCVYFPVNYNHTCLSIVVVVYLWMAFPPSWLRWSTTFWYHSCMH
jgi:hypothetical protein